jgi:predicted DNA-binding WGR domain protein
MRIYMQIAPTPNKPPGFYHLILQPDLLGGWSLIRESGRQGATGRVRRDHYPDRDSAIEAMMRLRDERLKGGYRVVYVQGEQRPA